MSGVRLTSSLIDAAVRCLRRQCVAGNSAGRQFVELQLEGGRSAASVRHILLKLAGGSYSVVGTVVVVVCECHGGLFRKRGTVTSLPVRGSGFVGTGGFLVTYLRTAGWREFLVIASFIGELVCGPLLRDLSLSYFICSAGDLVFVGVGGGWVLTGVGECGRPGAT